MKCSKCSQEATYFRKHEGNHYCKNCFCRQIGRTFKKNIRDHIKKNDKIFIEGGVAKTVLVYLLRNTLKYTSFKISKMRTHSKIVNPTTSDEKAEQFLKQFLFGKHGITKNDIEPLSNILKDEIKLYAKFKKIKFNINEQRMDAEGVRHLREYKGKDKLKEDKKLLEIKEILNELEEKRPGTKMQIAKYVEKIK